MEGEVLGNVDGQFEGAALEAVDVEFAVKYNFASVGVMLGDEDGALVG